MTAASHRHVLLQAVVWLDTLPLFSAQVKFPQIVQLVVLVVLPPKHVHERGASCILSNNGCVAGSSTRTHILLKECDSPPLTRLKIKLVSVIDTVPFNEATKNVHRVLIHDSRVFIGSLRHVLLVVIGGLNADKFP